jgi:tripartite-type tricarboxylate transporter receptor subunit TctC
MFKRLIIKIAVCAASIIALASTAQATGQWPDRPVTIIVPIDAGTVQDVIARQLAKSLTTTWNQPVTVINRSGAAGIVGTQALASSLPDGYTLGLVSAPFTGVLALKNNLPYSREDISGVSKFARQNFMIFASKNAPFDNIQQLISYARANPNKLDYATPGIGSYVHITMEHLAKTQDLKLKHIPYRAMAQATLDVNEGRVHLVITSASPSLDGLVSKGEMKIVGSLSDGTVHRGVRIQSISSVIPDVKSNGYYALIAPKGTPKAIVNKIHKDVSTALTDPEIVRNLADVSVSIDSPTTGSDEFDRWIDNEISRLKRIVKLASIQVE